MHIKKYTEYINESIDTILDKINDVGYNNLTNFDRFILNNASDTNTTNDCINMWLDYMYSNLKVYEIKRKSFGTEKEFLIYNDENDDTIFEYCKKYKILYASYDDITKEMQSCYDENVIMDWFEDNYNIKIERLSNFFVNIN